MKTRRSVLLLSALVVYLVVEALCFAGLWLLDRVIGITYDPNPSALSENQKASLAKFLETEQGKHVGQSLELGWIHQSEANSAGMRDDLEYHPAQPPPGVFRIAAYGDSFTYSSDVALYESWTKQISAIAPSIEMLNYGNGAWGLDQAYLRYRQVGADYHPHAVFIGYMSENIGRHVNVFRGFYTNMYRDTIFTKPRFVVEEDQLVLLPNPLSTLEDYRRFLRNDGQVLREIAEHDYHYNTHYNRGWVDFSPFVRLLKMSFARLSRHLVHHYYLKPDGSYNPNSEAFAVTVRIFDAFHRDVLANGAMPIIVIFPDLRDQQRSRAGEPLTYEPLLEHFRDRGYRSIELIDALKPYESRYGTRELTVKWGHFSPLGNKIAAAYITDRLAAWDLVSLPTRTEQQP